MRAADARHEMPGRALLDDAGGDILAGGSGQDIMTGKGGADTFVIDADALARLDLADVIADYSDGDVLDLSGLLDVLVGGMTNPAEIVSPVATAAGDAVAPVDATGLDGSVIEVTPPAGAHATISILYDDNHAATVTA